MLRGRGGTKAVELLLKQEANIEAQNKDGLTALHLAAREGKTETAALLLEAFIAEKGIDATVRRYGKTALIVAAEAGKTDTAALLLKHGTKH